MKPLYNWDWDQSNSLTRWDCWINDDDDDDENGLLLIGYAVRIREVFIFHQKWCSIKIGEHQRILFLSHSLPSSLF